MLRAYARFRSELRNGSLPYATQQRIALAVAEHQGSEYALATLQRTARDAGLGLDEIALAREFDSRDEREAVLLRFVKALLETRRRAAAAQARGGPRGGLGRTSRSSRPSPTWRSRPSRNLVTRAGDVPLDGSSEESRLLDRRLGVYDVRHGLRAGQ